MDDMSIAMGVQMQQAMPVLSAGRRRHPRSKEARALASLLTYSPWNVRVGKEVVDRLLALGVHAVPALTCTLRRNDADTVVRLLAARILSAIADREPRVRADVRAAFDGMCACETHEIRAWIAERLESATVDESAA